MRDLAKKLRRVPLFLEWIGIIGRSNDVDFVRDHLPRLSFALGSDQCSGPTDGSAGGQPLYRCIIWQRVFRDDLKVAQTRAIVQLDKREILRIAPGSHPALDLNRIDRLGAL